MIFTINQLNAELQAIQDAHLQLNSYFWGDFLDAYKSRTLNYPLMCCYYVNGGGSSAMLVPINLIIIVADKTYKDNSNLTETESDSLQVCKDILNVISKSARWKSFSRFNSYTLDKFVQSGADEVAGHILRVNISLKDRDGVCGLPMPGYDFGQTYGLTCAPVMITDSDGTTTFDIPSGGSFVCTPVAPVTVKNPSGSYLYIAAPGETVVTPNINVTLDGGNTVLNVESVEDLNFSDYYEVIFPSGSRVPVNTVVDPLTEVGWFNLSSNVTTSIGAVEKISDPGFNARANFMIPTNGDFRLDFKLLGSDLFAGVSFIDVIASYQDIGFAISASGTNYYLYESGVNVTSFGGYLASNQHTIERSGGAVKYYINGVLKFTQTLLGPTTLNSYMVFDCTIFNIGDKVHDTSITYLS